MAKATAPTWRRPPVRVRSSLYGRSNVLGQRSRTRGGWNGRVPQDATPSTDGVTAAATAATIDDDDVDDDDLDTDVGGEKSDAPAVPSARATPDDDDDDDAEKSDCVVSLPPDQACLCVFIKSFPDLIQYR